MASNIITDELLAAFLDGCTDEAETQQVLTAMKTDLELREVLDIALQLEDKKHWTSIPKEKVRESSTVETGSVLSEKKNNRIRKNRPPRQTPGKNIGLMATD